MSALTYIRIRGLEEAGDVFQGIGGDVSSSSSSGGGENGDTTFLTETLSDEWKAFLDALTQYLIDFESWGSYFVDAFESNIDEDEEMYGLPIPMPPTLPVPPGVGGPLSAIIAVIVFVVKWAAAHRDLIIKIFKLLEILKKLREIIRGGETDIGAAFKKAFLYAKDGDEERSVIKDGLLFDDMTGEVESILNRGTLFTDSADNLIKSIFGHALLFKDPQDDLLKSVLDRGLLLTLNPSGGGNPTVKSILDLRLADLLYNDVEIDLPGGVRYYVHSKVSMIP